MLSNKRLVLVCLFALCCNMTLLTLLYKLHSNEKCFLSINSTQKYNSIPEDFLSVGIDASSIEDYKKIAFSNSRFRILAEALAPAKLRLGGTMSERLIFNKEDVPVHFCEDCYHNHTYHVCSHIRKFCRHKHLPFFIMTSSKWDEINDFCKATNLSLLFSVNLLLRNENSWNSQNALELVQYSASKGYKLDWQLGNEPNSFLHTYNITVTPKQLAHDFKTLRGLLNKNYYQNSLLVGPDTTRPQDHRPECLKYMQEFLSNASHYINARSWHQYYLNSRTAKLIDFWKPETLNLLYDQITTMTNHTTNYSNIPMWLSETSSSYGGGAPGLSNTFAGSPLWLDKLGLSAKLNVKAVIRQSLVGGNYSLIDENMNPLPDWWISVLFKKLVGNRVLHVECNCSDQQRFYAHCANNKYINDTTAITIYGVNLDRSMPKIFLTGTAIYDDNLQIDEFIVSAPSNNRMSTVILLNGWPLHASSTPQDLKPRSLKYHRHITMPPYSVGFWVVKNTKMEKICA